MSASPQYEVAAAQQLVHDLRRPRSLRLPPGLLALLGYVAAGCVVFSATVRHPLHSTLDGGKGDVGNFLWLLANTSKALLQGHGHGLFITHALNAPIGVNTLWNTGVLLPAAVLAPVTALAGPVLSLNLIVVMGPVLSAWTAFLCSGRLLHRRSSRFVTGAIFGFSPAVLAASLGHFHLTLLLWVPPMLLLTLDAATGRRGPVRSGLLLGVVVALQLLTGEEVLVLTAVACLVLVTVLGLQRPRDIRPRLRPVMAAALVAASTTLTLVGYPLYVQFFGPLRVQGSIQPANFYVLDPVRTIVPSPGVLLRSRWLDNHLHPLPLNASEAMGYLGLPMLILVVATAWALRRNVAARTAALTSAVLLLLAMGYTLHFAGRQTRIRLPWDVTSHAPVLGSLLPVRWMLVAMLPLAVLVGMALDALPPSGPRRWAAAGLLGLCLVPLLPARAPAGQPTGTPTFFTRAGRDLRGTVLVVPVARPVQNIAMTWAAEASDQFSMPGGYFVGPGTPGPDGTGHPQFGDTPRPTEIALLDLETTGVSTAVTDQVRAQASADLAYWKVHTVVLGPSQHEQALLRWLTELLMRRPAAREGVWIWTSVSASGIRART